MPLVDRAEKSCEPGELGSGNALGIWGTFEPNIYAVLSNFGICRMVRSVITIFMVNVIKLRSKAGSGWGTFCMIGEHLGQHFLGNISPPKIHLVVTGEHSE